MENNLNETFSKLTEFLKSEAKTEAVVGQPFQLGEFTCVPVIGMGMGIGAGGGEGKNEKQEGGTGAGGGAGIGIGPVGFLVTHKDQIQFISARHPSGLSNVFEKLPDLINTYINKKEKQSTTSN